MFARGSLHFNFDTMDLSWPEIDGLGTENKSFVPCELWIIKKFLRKGIVAESMAMNEVTSEDDLGGQVRNYEGLMDETASEDGDGHVVAALHLKGSVGHARETQERAGKFRGPEMSRDFPKGLLRDERDRGSRVVEGSDLDAAGKNTCGGRSVGRRGRKEGGNCRDGGASEQPREGTWRISRPLI